MGLGVNAGVTASHLLMVAIITVTIYRFMVLMNIPRGDLGLESRWLFPNSICMVLFALVIERLYYVAARMLKGSGVDLWSAYPAPAILSSLVALSVMWLTPAYLRALGGTKRSVRIRVGAELVGSFALWSLFYVVLK